MISVATPPPRVELYRIPLPIPEEKPPTKITTSLREIEHILIALILFFLVVISHFSGVFSAAVLPIIVAGIGLAFIIHELAHKFVAQRYGLWAEFRLVGIGVLFTLLSIIMPIGVIAPGAVMIFGFEVTHEQMGKIALAGPLTNLIQAFIFLAFASRIPILTLIAVLNIWYATFNLLPLAILDGKKIFDWSKSLWGLFFGLSAALFIFLMV